MNNILNQNTVNAIVFKLQLIYSIVVGKSFGLVGIDIECKNISISGDIGGFILSTK